ncbi:MAG TPA: DNA N-6-adenine-methyltransferase [Anaerovoracaceae bacterium]|nr:DNA N-6-adenine-methyltransferase [Anaerovoracaceae bacterium]
MARQSTGRGSKQDYGTPPEFITAVGMRLRDDFTWDLAASQENAIAECFYTEADNSLNQRWHELAGWLWLNPPFTDITPWVKKAYLESQLGARIAVLVPLSFAEWWDYWVDDKAYVLMLAGRLQFVGATSSYPKECALLLYTPEGQRGYELWRWKL